MDMYMGDRSTFVELGDPGYDYPRQIQDTARRFNGLHDGRSETGHAYLWVYCNEDSFWFRHCRGDETSAIVAYEQEDNYFNNWYITFCPGFFNSRFNVPLEDMLQRIRDQRLDPEIMENYYPSSQASTFFHESFHMSQLVTVPQAIDYAYGPWDVYNLAREHNTDRAVFNSDSWTLAAGAIFAQQEFSLATPPAPYRTLVEDADAAEVEDPTVPTTVHIESDGNFVPEGAGDRAPNEPFYVDEDLWEIVVRGATDDSDSEPPPEEPDEPDVDGLECNGISGSYWIEERDVAVESIEDFCFHSDWNWSYEQRTVNEVELSVERDGDIASPSDFGDCVEVLTEALDACDQDEVANPEHYKYGFTLTLDDGWVFTLTPGYEHVNEVGCNVTSTLFSSDVEVHGSNWPPAELGEDGAGLREGLEGCAPVDGWSFEMTPDGDFEWHASARLPIGADWTECVGEAVLAAGGSGVDGCEAES